MRAIRRALGIVIAATCVFGLGASPVAAARATAGSFEIEDHFVDSGASAVCGFPVQIDLTGVIRYEQRFDGNGNAVALNLHIQRAGTVSANGVSLSEFDRDTLIIDLVAGTQREVGIVYRIRLPDGGTPLVFDRGMILVDGDGNFVQVSGPHPGLEGDFERVCAALGG
jgi:hypothetical protein